MLQEASWSRSNSFWGTFRFKRRSATLAANSGFDQPSMIALASSRILEQGARLWKDCRLSTRRSFHPESRVYLTGANRPADIFEYLGAVALTPILAGSQEAS